MAEINYALGGGATQSGQAAPGSELTANEKRIASCKRVGGEKKRRGHKMEDVFMLQFGVPTATTYKAEADCEISDENPEGEKLMSMFPELKKYRVSVKSGKNLQFTLGRIDEVTNADDKISAIKKRSLWEKYLGKSESDAPADLLAYKLEEGGWVLFDMNAVIDFIVENCEWRQLESGRLKGDFFGLQYLTYEYRDTHKSYFLGANGNKGLELIKLLLKKIHFVKVEDK